VCALKTNCRGLAYATICACDGDPWRWKGFFHSTNVRTDVVSDDEQLVRHFLVLRMRLGGSCDGQRSCRFCLRLMAMGKHNARLVRALGPRGIAAHRGLDTVNRMPVVRVRSACRPSPVE